MNRISILVWTGWKMKASARQNLQSIMFKYFTKVETLKKKDLKLFSKFWC